MSLKAEDLWMVMKNRGPRWVIITLLSGVILGLVNHVTDGIVPYIVAKVTDHFDPPTIVVVLKPPVEYNKNNVKFYEIGEPDKHPRKVSEAHREYVILQAESGHYRLELSRERDGSTKNLVAVISTEKRDQRFEVNASDDQWVDEKAFELPGYKADTPTPPPSFGTTGILAGTRWALAEPDFQLLAHVSDPATRALLFKALNDVGTHEAGSPKERGRIASYWETLGQHWADRAKSEGGSSYPWGGAFVAWAVSQAGFTPPVGAAAFKNWLKWGEAVPSNETKPGTIAIFSLSGSEVPEAVSKLLVGVVMRKQENCIEVILANVADRVVISCVSAPLVALRQPVEDKTAPVETKNNTLFQE